MLCPTGNRSDRCEYLTKVHLAHHRAVGGGRGGRGHHRARRGARGRQPRLLGRRLANLEVSALGLAHRLALALPLAAQQLLQVAEELGISEKLFRVVSVSQHQVKTQQ